MHSGTHLLRYQILGSFFKDDESPNFNGNSNNKMIGFHVDQRHRFEREIEDYQIFAPMRHPRRIAKSFNSRKKLKARLPYTQKNLDKQWDILIDLDKKNPIYLHVDNDIRNKEVELISRAVEIELLPDWTACRRSGAVAGNHEVDLDDCPQAPQYQIDFYYETIERMKDLWINKENLR